MDNKKKYVRTCRLPEVFLYGSTTETKSHSAPLDWRRVLKYMSALGRCYYSLRADNGRIVEHECTFQSKEYLHEVSEALSVYLGENLTKLTLSYISHAWWNLETHTLISFQIRVDPCSRGQIQRSSICPYGPSYHVSSIEKEETRYTAKMVRHQVALPNTTFDPSIDPYRLMQDKKNKLPQRLSKKDKKANAAIMKASKRKNQTLRSISTKDDNVQCLWYSACLNLSILHIPPNTREGMIAKILVYHATTTTNVSLPNLLEPAVWMECNLTITQFWNQLLDQQQVYRRNPAYQVFKLPSTTLIQGYCYLVKSLSRTIILFHIGKYFYVYDENIRV